MVVTDKALDRLNSILEYSPELAKSTATQEFFQVDFSQVFDISLEYFDFSTSDERLPSFNKAVKDVSKARNLWEGIVDAAYGSGFFLTSLSDQIGSNPKAPEQIFLPENTKSKSALEIVKIFNDRTPHNIKFIPLIGGRKVYGKKVSNQSAESIAKECIEAFSDQKVVFVCVKIGQRSFSISRLEVVHLMYDNGSAAGTGQKSARAKTAEFGQFDKVAKIVSWSLDPKRDQKVDLLYIEEATRYAYNNKVSKEEAFRKVFESMPFFRPGKTETIKVSHDQYMSDLDARSSFDSASARRFDPELLPSESLEKFKNIIGNGSATTDPTQRLPLGKTNWPTGKKVERSKADPDEVKKLFEHVKKLSTDGVRALKECRYLVDQDKEKLSLDKLLEVICNDSDNSEWFGSMAGYDIGLFLEFIDSNCWGFNNNYLRNVIEI